MPVLPNARHERMAQLIAAGHTAVDAHEQAGYKRNEGNASTLASKPEIKGRINEIKSVVAAKVTERLAVTREDILGELWKIAFAPVGHEHVKPADKRAACVDYAKIEGWHIERREIGLPGEFAALQDDELMDDLRAEAAQLGIDVEDGATAH